MLQWTISRKPFKNGFLRDCTWCPWSISGWRYSPFLYWKI